MVPTTLAFLLSDSKLARELPDSGSVDALIASVIDSHAVTSEWFWRTISALGASSPHRRINSYTLFSQQWQPELCQLSPQELTVLWRIADFLHLGDCTRAIAEAVAQIELRAWDNGGVQPPALVDVDPDQRRRVDAIKCPVMDVLKVADTPDALAVFRGSRVPTNADEAACAALWGHLLRLQVISLTPYCLVFSIHHLQVTPSPPCICRARLPLGAIWTGGCARSPREVDTCPS
jgi:hypothetical protein